MEKALLAISVAMNQTQTEMQYFRRAFDPPKFLLSLQIYRLWLIKNYSENTDIIQSGKPSSQDATFCAKLSCSVIAFIEKIGF